MSTSSIVVAVVGFILSILSLFSIIGGIFESIGVVLLVTAFVLSILAISMRRDKVLRARLSLAIVLGFSLLRLALGSINVHSDERSLDVVRSQVLDSESIVRSKYTITKDSSGNLLPQPPDGVVPTAFSPSALYALFEKNKVRAEEELRGTWISVRGKVSDIDKDNLNHHYNVYLELSEDAILQKISCNFDFALGDLVKNLNQGDVVTIVGESPWMNISYVELRNCLLLKK